MEVYMENIVDLLAEGIHGKTSLQIRENPVRGVYVEGLIEKVWRAAAYKLIESKNKGRAVCFNKKRSTEPSNERNNDEQDI